ncbi:MAG: hypothetical protein SPK75_07010, partial [Victivallales bacterium]|nr:hypothetical protein [Victivallales bacterium]
IKTGMKSLSAIGKTCGGRTNPGDILRHLHNPSCMGNLSWEVYNTARHFVPAEFSAECFKTKMEA